MKKICKIILCFLLVISIGGCSKSIHISKEEFLEDYDYLWNVLEENYMFFDLLASNGFDKEYVKNKYRNTIHANTTIVDYYQMMRKMIMEFQFEGHLQLFDVEQYFDTKGVFDREVIKQGEDLSFLAMYDLDVEERYQYLARELNIDFKEKEEGSIEEVIKIEEWEELNTLYIKIDSFSLVGMSDNISLIRTMMQEKQYNNIVIDIRENSGGTTAYWLSLLSLILTENFESHRTLEFKGEESLRYLEYLPDNIIENNKFILTRTIEVDTTVYKPNQLYILSSNQNYSAADEFLRIVKTYELGTIIGSPSWGSGGSGMQPMQIKLPNSKLLIEFEPAILLEDGEPIRNSGVEPDIHVTPSDAYNVCLDIIREQNGY